MPVTSLLRLCSIALAVCIFTGQASAQLNNAAPYSFPGSSGGGSISPAYRQAILQKKILGVQPSQLQLDAGGSLLNVQSSFGGQTFATYPQTVYLAAGAGLGFGIGGGIGSVDYTYPPIITGIQGSTPINAWIAQLDTIK